MCPHCRRSQRSRSRGGWGRPAGPPHAKGHALPSHRRNCCHGTEQRYCPFRSSTAIGCSSSGSAWEQSAALRWCANAKCDCKIRYSWSWWWVVVACGGRLLITVASPVNCFSPSLPSSSPPSLPHHHSPAHSFSDQPASQPTPSFCVQQSYCRHSLSIRRSTLCGLNSIDPTRVTTFTFQSFYRF
ncbi:hypothetical protein DFH27DRAFT_25124 [Peziza echinospora]|nr:hypothetical protein DFH27DRAFT_25124 [Peziza echinospora]